METVRVARRWPAGFIASATDVALRSEANRRAAPMAKEDLPRLHQSRPRDPIPPPATHVVDAVTIHSFTPIHSTAYPPATATILRFKYN